MKVIFSHGKESGPWGSKIKRLAQTASEFKCDVDSIDYSGISNPDERVSVLFEYLEKESQPFVLVGSSMGGYVSLVTASKFTANGIFLLAPALYMPGYREQKYATGIPNLAIVHGWSDNIIPASHSIKYANEAKCSLYLIDGDHRLNSSIDQVDSLFSLFLKDCYS